MHNQTRSINSIRQQEHYSRSTDTNKDMKPIILERPTSPSQVTLFVCTSSVDDSSLWTEEFDELESISLMDDDLEVLPLEPMLAPSRAPPPFGEKAIL